MNKDPHKDIDKEAYELAYLVAGYIRGTLTDKESSELNDWVNASDHNMLLFEDLTDERNLEANLKWMDRVQTRHSFNRLKESGAFRRPVRSNSKLVWMAAASVVVIISAYLLYHFTSGRPSAGDTTASIDSNLLQPGGNRAILTLQDGTQIDLSATSIGTIQKGEGSHVSKPADGEIVYEQEALAVTGNEIHTLSTPIGGQYQVTLPDGTRAWLNAASRLTFPAKFPSGERRVVLEGEAYFEVAKKSAQPFRVMLGDSSMVSVLGTHFNIMAYGNEPGREVALVEGRVEVRKGSRKVELSPGMLATVKGASVDTRSNVDLEEITGWKNGMFVFHDASIETIMRQVERWYGARVIYEGAITQQFNGTIRRGEPLSQLLRLLQLTKHVMFRIENKTIYVLPG